MRNKKKILWLVACVFLCNSCTQSYVQVEKVQADRSAYAARFAKSPHPYALNPPKGEKLYVNWSIPVDFEENMYRMKVSVIYRDLSVETLYYPIKRRAGAKIIELLGKDFEKRKGFLSYKMEIVSLDGNIISNYTHRMWVDIIVPCDNLR